VGGAQLPFLPVERAVVAKLLGEQIGAERGGQHAAGQQAGFQGSGEGRGVRIVLAHMDEALDDFQCEGGRRDMEPVAGLLSDPAEEFGMGEHFGMNDFAGRAGQALEGFAEFVRAPRAVLLVRGFSRRGKLASIGGFGLSRLVAKKVHEELIVARLLALRPVDALDQGGDDVFLDGQFAPEGLDLRREQAVLLFESFVFFSGRFDARRKAS